MMFGALAKDAVEAVATADARINQVFAPHRDHPLMEAVAAISKLGDQPPLRMISGLCLAAGLIASSRRLTRAGARMLLAHELATLAKDMIKDEVDRKRPRTAISAGEAKPRPGRSSEKEDTSFPSGHTAGSVAVARAFGREFPEYRVPALGAAAVVAAALVPRCAHYLSDVGAGALVGLASEAAANAIWRDGSGHGAEGD